VETPALTAIGNDYSYDEIFARQLRGVRRPGDVLVALSTSGDSENVHRAVSVATEMGISTIGTTGQGGKSSGPRATSRQTCGGMFSAGKQVKHDPEAPGMRIG